MNIKIPSLKSLSIALVAIFIFGIITTASVFAMRGGKYMKMMTDLPAGTMEEVQTIFSEGDYADLEEFMERTEIQTLLNENQWMAKKAEMITAENFPLMAEMMQLKMEMKQLYEQSDFGEMKKGHSWWEKGDRPTEEQREAMNIAMEAGDYDAWVAAAPTEKAEMVTAENFEQFAKMHGLKSRMQEIGEELGFSNWKGHGKGGCHGWKNKSSEETQ